MKNQNQNQNQTKNQAQQLDNNSTEKRYRVDLYLVSGDVVTTRLLTAVEEKGFGNVLMQAKNGQRADIPVPTPNPEMQKVFVFADSVTHISITDTIKQNAQFNASKIPAQDTQPSPAFPRLIEPKLDTSPQLNTLNIASRQTAGELLL